MVDSKAILDSLLGAVASKNTSSSSDTGGLGDLLGAVLGGGSASGSTGGSGLGNLLGAVLGGGGAASQNKSGGGLSDLLGSALSGGSAPSGSTGGGLSDLIGSAFGGGSASQSKSGGGLSDLLGAALGGGSSSQSKSGGGLSDLLGAALGGGASASDATSGGSAATVTGGGLVDLLKDAVTNNPAMAKTVAAGAAGLLLGTKSGRALSASAVKLGGLALIGTLAYKSLKSYQEGSSGNKTDLSLPGPEKYVPAAAQSEDGSLRLARTMVAAAMADGTLDAEERSRIAGGLAKTGGSEVGDWLKKELGKPATPEELAKGVTSIPEAAEIYTAARVTIEPDKDAEIDFLNRLADALNLDGSLVAELDKSVMSVKTDA